MLIVSNLTPFWQMHTYCTRTRHMFTKFVLLQYQKVAVNINFLLFLPNQDSLKQIHTHLTNFVPNFTNFVHLFKITHTQDHYNILYETFRTL